MFYPITNISCHNNVYYVDNVRRSKTVVVTLWGNLAETVGEQLHSLVSNASNPIVAISSCRVSSYNGVSVSTLTRSHVMVNPSEESVPESKALQEWFKEHGRDNEMTAVGEGLATMKYEVHLLY